VFIGFLPVAFSPTTEAETAVENPHRRLRMSLQWLRLDDRQITELLIGWREGDRAAFDRLVPLVHAELRNIARNRLRGERADHTLQPTALVNEAYLRLAGLTHLKWQNRAQFFAVAARLMRMVLVDAARDGQAAKRGGGSIRVTFNEALIPGAGADPDIIALDDAMHALARKDQRKARVVELRFFGGLSVEETAEVLGLSEDTVTRDWKFARAWLRRQLESCS
jgi:RNA polymerase sigma factor (TIGR02999 family)